MITEDQLKQQILDLVKKQGSQKQAAKELGISLSYLNDYLSGKRDAGKKILYALNLKRITYYEYTN